MAFSHADQAAALHFKHLVLTVANDPITLWVVKKYFLTGGSIILFVFCRAALADFRLPADAKIQIEKAVHSKSADGAKDCVGFELTKSQLRKIFATYKVVSATEIHDFYLWSDCFISGTVTAKGKSFSWKARPGHLIETEYPDGKLKTLGGKQSDSPDGK